jgi:hypothetical protein
VSAADPSWPSEGKFRGDLHDSCNELVLEPGNVRRLAPVVIGAARMLPLADRTVVVVVVGTDFGNLMFWDASRPAWKQLPGEGVLVSSTQCARVPDHHSSVCTKEGDGAFFHCACNLSNGQCFTCSLYLWFWIIAS